MVETRRNTVAVFFHVVMVFLGDTDVPGFIPVL